MRKPSTHSPYPSLPRYCHSSSFECVISPVPDRLVLINSAPDVSVLMNFTSDKLESRKYVLDRLESII